MKSPAPAKPKRRRKPPSDRVAALAATPIKPFNVRKPRGLNRGTTTYDRPQWRFRDLLHALGTDREISDKLVMRGYPRVPPNSIFGWMRRDTVPSVWLPVILQMGVEARFIKKIEDLRVL